MQIGSRGDGGVEKKRAGGGLSQADRILEKGESRGVMLSGEKSTSACAGAQDRRFKRPRRRDGSSQELPNSVKNPKNKKGAV